MLLCFSSFFSFVHLVVVLLTEDDVNPGDIFPAYSGQYKSTSAWNTCVSLISAFFFLGKGIKWRLVCLGEHGIRKKGEWWCVLIAKDRKAEERSTAVLRIGEFLPWESGVPSCWVVSSQESARDHCPIGPRFLVFILSSLFFQSLCCPFFKYFSPFDCRVLCSLVPNCFATLWTTACQALPVGSSQQGYWGGLPFRPPGDLLTRGLNLPLSHLLRCRWTLSLWASGEAFRCFSPAVELTSLSVACFSWFLRRLTLVSGHCFSGRGHLRPLERLHRILFPATGPEHALVFTSELQSFSLALSDQHPIAYHFLRDLLLKHLPAFLVVPSSMGFLVHLPSKLEKSFIGFFPISSIPSL